MVYDGSATDKAALEAFINQVNQAFKFLEVYFPITPHVCPLLGLYVCHKRGGGTLHFHVLFDKSSYLNCSK